MHTNLIKSAYSNTPLAKARDRQKEGKKIEKSENDYLYSLLTQGNPQ